MEVKLEKTIYKNQDGNIIHENYLTADREAKIKVEFENIEYAINWMDMEK